MNKFLYNQVNSAALTLGKVNYFMVEISRGGGNLKVKNNKEHIKSNTYVETT